MLCGNPMCENVVPEGIGTEYWRLPEEKKMTVVPRYCSANCAMYVRRSNYLTGESSPLRVVEGTMRVNGGSPA